MSPINDGSGSRRSTQGRVTRRGLLKGTAATGAATLTSYRAGAQEAAKAERATTVPVTLTINGSKQAFTLDARTTLLDLLREEMDLTGTKVGCNHGQCGACTVLLDGTRINSCMMLAAAADGGSLTTIEGLGGDEELHPMQAAFIEHDGFQCGYCTPGQLCSATGMLGEIAEGWPSHVSETLEGGYTLTEEELSERMSGNLCRCSCYPGINAAIREVAEAEEQDA